MRNLKFLFFSWIVLWGGWLLTLNFSFATEGSNAHDLLEQAFTPAIDSNKVIWGGDIGSTKEQVWSYVLREGNDLKLKFKRGENEKVVNFQRRTSLLVQISKFLLRLTIILSITMIIYNGVMYLIKASKGENPKEIYTNIWYIVTGVLLGLSSVIIIRFISSIGQTTLNSIS